MALAKSLELTVTAEGVECELQERHLRDLGCDRGQGYWFSEPLPAAWMGRLLEEHAGGVPAIGRNGTGFTAPALKRLAG
jgi:EAL domain-containing protein (putative c-di-GMP-specific phosphodiesterase class I)